jgi:Universal stress protein family
MVGPVQRDTEMNSQSPIRRILVPHDFGDAAEAALLYAIRFAGAFGARITLLHAFEDPAEGADDAADLVREMDQTLPKRSVDRRSRRSRRSRLLCGARALRSRQEFDAEGHGARSMPRQPKDTSISS